MTIITTMTKIITAMICKGRQRMTMMTTMTTRRRRTTPMTTGMINRMTGEANNQ